MTANSTDQLFPDPSSKVQRTDGMTFTRADRWREVSVCSSYQVIAIPDRGTWRFEAWTLQDPRTLGDHLGTFAAAEDARRACARERKRRLRAVRQDDITDASADYPPSPIPGAHQR